MIARVRILLLGLLAAGCSDPEPRWTDLASVALRDDAAAERREVRHRLADGSSLAFVVRDGVRSVESTLDGARFSPHPKLPDLWWAPVALRGREGRPADPPRASLVGEERSFRLAPGWRAERPGALPEGHFALARSPFDPPSQPSTLWLRLAPGAVPPERLTLNLGAETEVESGRERVTGRRFTTTGIAVRPGESVALTTDLPRRGALRFATATEPASRVPPRMRQGALFRVTLSGRTIFEHLEPTSAHESFRWHTVPLPEAATVGARLTFTVQGDPVHGSFAAPTLGPARVGRPGARPWPEARPDLVVFLADTLRADTLAAYGGTLGLTPNLDALAKRSQVFRRAWSVSTYTLPAHASMFSGYYPAQSGAISTGRALPARVETIAERLGAAGYRTGAITDSVVVSSRAGLDQGFQWFDELQRDLDSTLERALAFLDADDGRPVFLFVHSYRAHAPYRVSERTRRERGAELGIDGDWQSVGAELTRIGRPDRPKRDGPERGDPREFAAAVRRLRALYRGGVVDLDSGFGTFRDELETRGLLEAGLLVFTSDHGEAFFEHEELYHTGRVFEEQTRVPLLLVGGGIEPGVRERAASLVDLAPTLLDAAGLEAPDGWPGRSLLRDGPDPAALMFQSQAVPGSTFAIVEGAYKLIGLENLEAVRRGRIHAAFDLANDPHERAPLAPEAAPWALPLLERLRPAVEAALEPRFQATDGVVDAERAEQLRAMGYVVD